MPSRKIWILSAALATVRLSIFAAIYLTDSHDAQWQLSYLPLWVVDLPISFSYHWIAFPLAEGIIGPAWWFFLPILLWWIFRRRRGDKT
jgi:hypothetical protein